MARYKPYNLKQDKLISLSHADAHVEPTGLNFAVTRAGGPGGSRASR